MPVQAHVAINFEAPDVDAVRAVIDGLSGVPEGATISSSVTEQVAMGTVNAQGAIEEPTLLAAPEEES